jgi:SAM-dependent methyltransferase
VRERLPPVEGRHVLHLQCGTGEATAVLAELGALVTGVDVSGEALAVAREKAPGAALVQADVHALPLELRRSRFDLVFTGGGVLTWLHDLDAWAGGIHAALRANGVLLLHEIHPVAQCIDEVDLRWRADYFDEEPVVGVGWSHFDLPGEAVREENGERRWRLGEIVTAVAASGMLIRRLEEFPAAVYHGWKKLDRRVPGEFVLIAEKPG